jgi:peroxiredoxin Q/BCP
MLEAGDKAPDFSLESDDGTKVSLRDFAGKTLVLYFYPKDDTPGCTREAQAFTAARSKIEKAGGVVVGVSRDTTARHCVFRDKYGLKIPLLSDPDRKVHEAYGAWGEKTMYGKKVLGAIRSTFLIKDGRVLKVFGSVKVDGHADQVLAALGGGGAATPKKKAAAAAKPKKKAAPKKKLSPSGGSAARHPREKTPAATRSALRARR